LSFISQEQETTLCVSKIICTAQAVDTWRYTTDWLGTSL